MRLSRWIGPAALGAAFTVTPAQAAPSTGIGAQGAGCPQRQDGCGGPARPAFQSTGCGVLPRGVRAGRDVRCGLVRVPLRHARPRGPAIRLAVRIVVGGSGTPVLLLGGGPGEPVAGLAGPLAAADGFAVLRDRAVILVDQRGVGASRPSLGCNRELRSLQTVDPAALAGAYGACSARLGQRTDLNAFRTLENAKDLNSVRRALGLRRLHVFGTSYGARLALVAARGTPRWMASLVLSSPVPGDANFVADAPRSFERALQTLFATCAASAECNAEFPDLAVKLDAALARLEAQPALLPPGSVLLALDAGTAAELIFALFYSAPGLLALPEVITQLAAGDYSFLEGEEIRSLAQTPLSAGMQRAFICSEEIARMTPAGVAAGLAGLSRGPVLLGRLNATVGLPTFGICSAFGARRAPERTFSPIRSRTPALVVTGTFDQITPPAYGVRTVRGLARGRLVELPTGHSPLLNSGRCGLGLLRAFLNAPTARLRRPASCATATPAALTAQLRTNSGIIPAR